MEEPEAVCRKLIYSKLNLTPESYWCWWVWSTDQIEEIPSTHKIRLCRAEKSKKILVPTHWNLWSGITAPIFGLFFTTGFAGYRDSCVCFNRNLWPVPDLLSHYLPPACTESKWPSLLLQCKLLKITVVSGEVFRHALLFLVKYAVALPLITRGQKGKFHSSGKSCFPAIFFFYL